jgi:hypothetical protein
MKKTIKILNVTINLVIFLALATSAVIGSVTGNFALAATAFGALNLLLITSIAAQLSEVKKMVSLMFLTTKATEAADLLSNLFNNLFTHSEEDEDEEEETEQEPKQKKCRCKCESKEPKKAKKKSTAKTE